MSKQDYTKGFKDGQHAANMAWDFELGYFTDEEGHATPEGVRLFIERMMDRNITLNKDQLQQILASAYCSDKHKDKKIDIKLVNDMVKLLLRYA